MQAARIVGDLNLHGEHAAAAFSPRPSPFGSEFIMCSGTFEALRIYDYASGSLLTLPILVQIFGRHRTSHSISLRCQVPARPGHLGECNSVFFQQQRWSRGSESRLQHLGPRDYRFAHSQQDPALSTTPSKTIDPRPAAHVKADPEHHQARRPRAIITRLQQLIFPRHEICCKHRGGRIWRSQVP
jgi:hypothetical protein